MPENHSSAPSDWAALERCPVAVTGATGFLGRALVRALVAAGAVVTTLHRSGHGMEAMRELGARPVRAPLTDGATLSQALAGRQVLFHLAYDVRADPASNLAAFDAVMAAAASGGVGRIVHASSVVVYDAWPGGTIDESAPWHGPVTGGYQQAKRSMEQRLLNGTLPAAILQPTIVYGPGSALWTDAPVDTMRQGGIVLPDPAGTCPAVFVEDVVQAALRAAILPDLGRERFLISGPDAPGWLEFWAAVRELSGAGEILREPLDQMRARLGPPPTPGAAQGPSAAARVSALARRTLGHDRFDALLGRLRALKGPTGPARPSRSALELYAASPVIRIDHARERLGYTPQFPFLRGMDACRKHAAASLP